MYLTSVKLLFHLGQAGQRGQQGDQASQGGSAQHGQPVNLGDGHGGRDHADRRLGHGFQGANQGRFPPFLGKDHRSFSFHFVFGNRSTEAERFSCVLDCGLKCLSN